MPGRAPCLLTLPEAVGGELGRGSAVEAFVGPHLCDLPILSWTGPAGVLVRGPLPPLLAPSFSSPGRHACEHMLFLFPSLGSGLITVYN